LFFLFEQIDSLEGEMIIICLDKMARVLGK